jgi:hypothetical protein
MHKIPTQPTVSLKVKLSVEVQWGSGCPSKEWEANFKQSRGMLQSGTLGLLANKEETHSSEEAVAVSRDESQGGNATTGIHDYRSSTPRSQSQLKTVEKT